MLLEFGKKDFLTGFGFSHSIRLMNRYKEDCTYLIYTQKLRSLLLEPKISISVGNIYCSKVSVAWLGIENISISIVYE